MHHLKALKIHFPKSHFILLYPIYSSENFPYFKTAKDGWKVSYNFGNVFLVL